MGNSRKIHLFAGFAMMALLFFLSVVGIQVVEVMALVATLLYFVSWHGRIEQQHDGLELGRSYITRAGIAEIHYRYMYILDGTRNVTTRQRPYIYLLSKPIHGSWPQQQHIRWSSPPGVPGSRW